MTRSALKLNRRPPLTTLAQRLMKTSFSINFAFGCPAKTPAGTVQRSTGSEGWAGCARRPRGPRLDLLSVVLVYAAIGLELQTAFARGIGKGFHLAVIDETAAIEDNPVNTPGLCPLG